MKLILVRKLAVMPLFNPKRVSYNLEKLKVYTILNLDDRSDQLTSSRQADQEAAQHLDQPFNVCRPGFT